MPRYFGPVKFVGILLLFDKTVIERENIQFGARANCVEDHELEFICTGN